jgi:hypothetical protein
MHPTLRTRLSVALALAAATGALGAPTLVLAQQRIDTVVVVSAAERADLRADTLTARALALQDRLVTWPRAATLHAMAAGLRAPEDPRGDASLRAAGFLLYHSGYGLQARRMLERAAARSTARGDVEGAAMAYIAAGYMAREQGRRDAASDFANRAHALASSPLLTATQRESILRHLSAPPTGASQVLGSIAPATPR